MQRGSRQAEPCTSQPYRLITTTDPDETLGEAMQAGRVSYHETLLAAANALAKVDRAYGTVVYDDGCSPARDLTEREERILLQVCRLHGVEALDIV